MIVPLITRADQPPVKPAARPVETSNHNVHTVVAFCVIALLLTLYGILRFPEFGGVIAQYNQF
jgi:hypothetical protein